MSRKFSKEFKLMVISLITEDKKTVSEISKFFDIDRQVIHNWLKRYKELGDDAFGESIPAPHETEYKKLLKERNELKEANEILKKVSAYFGKGAKKN